MITLFFMIEWDRYRFEKKCAGTRYAELVSLHPVGYVGHVLHNDAFGVRIVDALFFMLVWAPCDFHKKRAETRYAILVFLHPVEYVGHIVHLGASKHET
jgi:hypothetical protein